VKIEIWAVEKVVPYERNPRINDGAVEAVAKSIKAFGFRQPIVVDKDGVIIVGHTRLKAAISLGLKKVPVHVAEISRAEAMAYRLADNKTAELAEWDNDLLAGELAELEKLYFDLDITGFSVDELSEIKAGGGTKGMTDPDALPDPPKKPKTKTGQLFQLGAHRLLCGDSTKPEDVARLMGGECAVLMQTDPPYGVDYDNAERPNPGVAKPRVANDDLIDGEKLQEFLEATIRAALPHLKKHFAFYVWHPMLTQGTFFAAAAAADMLIHRQIIWAKPVLLLGRGDYHWKHELCFYGWVRGNRPPFYGQRNQTTVWEIGTVSQAERKEMDHATPKPVDLFVPPIENHTKAGEIMYEPFCGSGSQIIAAEQLGRRCYGMELAPQYCDVIIKRWENFTGKKAELIKDPDASAAPRASKSRKK
jgi:DNA modification methylase